MLLMPDNAVLGGGSAAAWFVAPFAGATEPVLAVVPPESAWRGPRGVRVHRRRVEQHEIVTLEDDGGAVRLTTPLRTAWEVCALEPMATAVALLTAWFAPAISTPQPSTVSWRSRAAPGDRGGSRKQCLCRRAE